MTETLTIPDYEDPHFIISDVHETEFELSVLKLIVPERSVWSADMGCGYGRLSGVLAERSQHTLFIDYSQSNIIRAKAKFANHSGDNYFILADIGNLPVRESVFDTVTLIRVFHHFQDPYSYMKKISRCIRGGGSLVMSFDSSDNIAMTLLRIIHTIKRGGSRNVNLSKISSGFFSATQDKRPIYFHTHRFVYDLLKSNGLYPVRKIYHGGLMDAIQKYGKIADIAVSIMEYGMMGSYVSRCFFPNVFLTCRKHESTHERKRESLQDVLICPACGQELNIKEQGATCNSGHSFPLNNGILDFRLK